MLMHSIRDGIITGALRRTKEFCGNCGEDTCVAEVTKIELPTGIDPSHRLIGYGVHAGPDGAICIHHRYLGIGCGCYGKFHRQLAHIEERMRREQ